MAVELVDVRVSEKGSEVVLSSGHTFWRADWKPDADILEAFAAAHEEATKGYRLIDEARAIRIRALKGKYAAPAALMESLREQAEPFIAAAKAMHAEAHAELLKRHGEECAKWGEPLIAAKQAADAAAVVEAAAEKAVEEKRAAILAYVEAHEKDAEVASLLAKAVPVAAEPVTEKEIG
jgi:hypothetical protein